MKTKTIEAYQLHDSMSEEVLGTIYIIKAGDDSSDHIFAGWGEYNKIQGEDTDMDAFVRWFNMRYKTKIGVVNLEFIQP